MSNLETIPKGWRQRWLRDVVQINPRRPQVNNPNTLVSFIRMEDVSEDAKIVGSEIKPYQVVSKGYTAFKEKDVLVAKITPCFENGKGALAENLTNGIGFGSTEFHVLRTKGEIDRGFLYYLTLSHDFRGYGELNMQGSAGQKRVPTDFLRSYRFLCPSLPEQRRIAEILGSWDKAIALTERRIEAARQRKKGLMQRLLTGRVRFPEFEGEEWREVRLKELGNCIRGVTYKPRRDLRLTDTSNTVRLLRANNISDNRINLDDLQYVISDRCKTSQYLERGDIAICMASGSKDLVGKAAPFQIDDSYDYTIGAFCAAFHAKNSLSTQFISQLFQSEQYRRELRRFSAGSLINNLRPDDIESIRFAIPSNPAEQRRIAAVLQTCDREIELLQKKRDVLQRQKKGLMQRLLSGRVRVNV